MNQGRNQSRLTSTPIVMVTDENGRRQVDPHSFKDISIEIPIEPIEPIETNTSTQHLPPRQNLRPPDKYQS